jgi:hypothetical protein
MVDGMWGREERGLRLCLCLWARSEQLKVGSRFVFEIVHVGLLGRVDSRLKRALNTARQNCASYETVSEMSEMSEI